MRRDDYLVCKILFAIKTDMKVYSLKHEENEINYHLKIIKQGGFIIIEELNDFDIPSQFYLTWQGEEFVRTAKTIERCYKAIEYLDYKFGKDCYPFSILTEWLAGDVIDIADLSVIKKH